MSLRPLRIFAALVLLGVFTLSIADQMTAYPSMSLADGRSTSTISATVLDISGHPVPDGTRVVFSTTLGSFRETIVTTIAGVARAILVAGSTPGVATVTATPLIGGAGPSTLQYEFVGDRSLLSSAREYIEIVAPMSMTYTVDTKIIRASGLPETTTHPLEQVSLRYRDVQIEADEIQVSVQNYELRARNATVRIGKVTYPHLFANLNLRLNMRAGFGMTTFRGHAPQTVAMQGRWFGFATEQADGTLSFAPPPERDRFGYVAIKGPAVTPATTLVSPNLFEFTDLSSSPSHITAKRAIVFPNRRVQFQRADIYVAETRIMRVPLYELNLLQNGSPVITESWINVQDNQPQVNYPYYLKLVPGQSQLIRFHTGDVSDRDGNASSGAYLDYELNWNRGDDMDGTFALRDLATSQFEVDLQQFMRIDSRTTASAQIGVPLDSGYYGAANVSHQFNGFDSALMGSASQTFRGLDVRSTDYQFSTMTTPRKIANTPLQLSYGVTANESENSLINQTQEAYGITSNLRSTPLKLNPRATLTTSLTASALQGENVAHGITLLGNATLTEVLNKHLSTTLIYNYTHDGFNDQVLGAHQLSSTTYWSGGPFSINLMAMKSLDIDRESLFGDLDYHVSKLWRLRGSYTYDRYLSDVDLDYSLSIGYHIGWREIGIIWSERTKRFGIQLLGATIN